MQMDKKLTHCHKPWMDISKATNGNDFPKNIDFCDVCRRDKVQRNKIFWQDDGFVSFICFREKNDPEVV